MIASAGSRRQAIAHVLPLDGDTQIAARIDEGHACAEGDTMTSDDVSTGGHEAEAKMGPTFQANGDEKPIVTVEGEQTGASYDRSGADSGVRDQSGHTGNRSDKWPATGLTNFKHPRG